MAEVIGGTDRTMCHWWQHNEEYGHDLLFHGQHGKPCLKRIPAAKLKQRAAAISGEVFRFTVRHFHERLREVEGSCVPRICLST
ncbi:MAG: hypothetical protein LLG20_05700 [Acidobacteriales bacterium]|nr:hypothetical protein [Terriglobales bacterium]